MLESQNRKKEIDFNLVEKKIGIVFKNKSLLAQAFCHRSYLNENPGFCLEHNERLEFLGDAVLELAVTERLYEMFPGRPEGQLTNLRAALVNAKMLSTVAGELGFNDYLLLSKGETREIGKARQYILANAFEAVMGAIYLDGGYKSAAKLVGNYLMPHLEMIMKTGSYKDAKSLFQEKAQEEAGVTPVYKVLDESGPDHDKRFVIGVFLGDECIAQGEGSSKQEGETDAAKNALGIKHW